MRGGAAGLTVSDATGVGHIGTRLCRRVAAGARAAGAVRAEPRADTRPGGGRPRRVRIGFHVSVGGGLLKALREAQLRRCQTIQVFSAAPSVWKRRTHDDAEDRAFVEGCAAAAISPIFIHAPYLLNLASGDMALWEQSIEVLRHELDAADRWRAEGVVVHLGSAGEDPVEAGMERVVQALNRAREGSCDKARIILENSAGQGNSVGHTLEQIGQIIEQAGADGLGVCIDTAHAFAAGYDLRTVQGLSAMLGQAEEVFGLPMLRLVHLNDSKSTLGSRVDRHEHIGRGQIGREGFRAVLSHPLLAEMPFIMETPKRVKHELEDDLTNLRRVRKLIPIAMRPPLPALPGE
ncbi:MAG TPA: endonuclease [Armatimonadetes bacterium]|nr:endonuclease [Armatimonadota bacterium]